MRILTFSLKGGTGKSTIALNWALTLGWGVVTNDLYSPVDRVLPKERVLKLQRDQPLPSLPKEFEVVYDFGGYVDDRVVQAMQDATTVIVPTTNAYADLQVALETIKEVEAINARILVVANKAGRGDLEAVQAVIGRFFAHPVLPLKATKALSRIYATKRPLSEVARSGPLNAYVYGEASNQFAAIIAAAKKGKS